MHEWSKRMLLRHYLQEGVGKTELARRFGVSRRTIHYWIESGKLARDLVRGQSRYTPRPAVASKLDPYKGIIEARLQEFPKLSAQRLFDEVRATVERDAFCGYRLHRADAAVNKMLAMAGRVEVRDFVDILHLDAEYLSLGALAWAACGKDPGFTPDFLLDHAAAHTAYRPADLAQLHLRVPLELPTMKRRWLEALDRARALVNRLPGRDVGCLYLDEAGSPTNPDPSSDRFQALERHHGSVGGAWPTVSRSTRRRSRPRPLPRFSATVRQRSR